MNTSKLLPSTPRIQPFPGKGFTRMPYIAEKSIQEVQERIDALEVVGEYLPLVQKGNRWWACCPFHNEKTPSFTVNPDTKTYHCFGCGKGGSILSFVMDMDKLSFPEAVEKLAKKAGVDLVYEKGGAGSAGAEQRKKAEENREALYELYRRTAGSFHYLLLHSREGAAAYRYIRERALSDETIEAFNLGYTPHDGYWLHKFLLKKGYSAELLAQSSLFSRKHPLASFFWGRLMFPIADKEGRIVAFGGRILEGAGGGESDAGPKYINSNESEIYHKGKTLFALDKALPAIRQTKAVYICEGYMDCIALHQAGVTNSVAPLGTAFTEDQAKLLGHWAQVVNLIFDADNAGQKAAEKGILTCFNAGLEAAVVIPGKGLLAAQQSPNGNSASNGSSAPVKDPADILKIFGSEALKNSLKSVILSFDYLVQRAAQLYDLASAEGKSKAAAWFFPYIKLQKSETERELWLANVVDALGIDRQALETDYIGWTKGQKKPFRREASPKAGEAGQEARPSMNDELYLLTLVFLNPVLYRKLRASFSMEELKDAASRKVYLALEEWFRKSGGSLPSDGSIPAELWDCVREESIRGFLSEKAASPGAFAERIEEQLEDSLRNIRQKALRERRLAIDFELKRKDLNQRELASLLDEKNAISRKLK
jgi:DNA primase